MPKTCPIWDLNDLYTGITDVKLVSDVSDCQKLATVLNQEWQGRLCLASADELAIVIRQYEVLLEKFGRVQSHAQLMFAANTSDPELAKHHQSIREVGAEIHAKVLFVELELASLDDLHMHTLLETPELAYFEPWLRRVRAMEPYQLKPEIEKMIAERAPTGSAAWTRLFDETTTAMRFPFQGSSVTEAEILDALSNPDATVRAEAGQSLSKTLKSQERLLSLILNTIAKDKQIEDSWRGFKRPVASRNLANDVDDNVVDALVNAVNQRNEDLTHRYYQMKASWLGVNKLNWWDRNAPLPGDDNRCFGWDEASNIVLDAFARFDSKMVQIAEPFFNNNWIDAAPRAGKSSGAFSHPVVPSVHPYILMNFSGKSRDVMTLAHEMGHGIHQSLAADKGYLMSDTPLTLAETASVFAEMLTFRHLLEIQDNLAARRFLLSGKVEDMLNTVVRQVAFHNFETEFHDARLTGELTADEIADIWMDTQRAAMGPGIKIGDDYRPIWSYVPHFVHTPFYVYAYAFGDCLVNALWKKYQISLQQGNAHNFIEQYTQLLIAGGTERYDEALKRFDLDASQSAFWSSGLDMINDMIDELERLE